MCRAVEEEKVVLRVHDFRPDVKTLSGRGGRSSGA